jgi:hypothetical protein
MKLSAESNRTRHLPYLTLAISLFAAVALITTGPPACAQPPPDSAATTIENKMVSVDSENSRLSDVLPDLMKTVGADYSLDSTIKNARVTIHITSAKFKPTLDTLMRVCDIPVTYRVEKGLYHFMALADAPPEPHAAPTPRSEAPSRPGPRYNGGDPLAVAVSELMQFLTGSESALSGKSPFPNNGSQRAGSGSLSGSRNFSEYGFQNGRLSSSSFQSPDIGNPQISSFGGGYGYFSPMGRGNGIIR